MLTCLCPNFLNDPREYQQAEDLWRGHWRELMELTGEGGRWQSAWINTTFADGSPQQDGNPIFSAVCPSRRFGIRVIQLEPSHDSTEFDFWTDVFAQGAEYEIRELVISCVLSEGTLSRAVDLMKQWIEQDFDTNG